MSSFAQYSPSPAFGAQVKKNPNLWTLILTRDLRHSPEKVWQALTDPAHLREWAPFDVDGDLDTVGAKVTLTWVGTGLPTQATVTRADRPRVLEFGNIRWDLQATNGGTRLTLWTDIDPRFVAWGAAGWHIGIDVLDHLLAGDPIGRIAGADGMKFEGWQRLVSEYSKQFAD